MAFGLLITANTSHAQRVMATSGGTYSSAEHDISWTIGEAITSTLGSNDHTLTQGLHQPTLTVTGIFVIKNMDIDFTVYPNPVEQMLTVDIGDYKNAFKLRIINNTGGVILNETYLSDFQKIDLNVESYLQGIYYMHVLSSSNTVLQSFKIVKL